MTLVVGATKFLTASTLANTQGLAPSTPSLLGEGSAASMLEAGRGALGVPGIGISGAARALNAAFLQRTADINSMFSLGLGPNATIEGMQTQIKALRSTLPVSQLSDKVTKLSEDAKATATDNGAAATDDSKGSAVDEEV